MNLISKFISSNKKRLNPGTETTVYGEAVKGAEFSQNDNELAMRKLLAYFQEAIHDDDFAAIMFDKVMPKVMVPRFDDKGYIMYARDELENILLDGKGEPIITYTEGRQVNDYYAALNNMLSQLNRLSFIDPKMIRLHSLYAEDVVSDILMSSPRSKLNSGEIAFLNSLYNMIVILLQDARGGNKLNALLTVRKENTADVNLRQNEKKGVF